MPSTPQPDPYSEKIMASDPSPSTETPEPAAASPATPASRSIRARIVVMLAIVVVVAVECAVVCLCLPKAGETAGVAGVAAKPAAAAKSPEHEAKADESEAPADVEVDLGEFSVTSFQPVSNTTLRIDFHLFGSVGVETEKDFRRLLDENKHRFREQVLMTVRSAEMTDLTDASLGLIKRTILDKARRTLGKPMLREVIVSDYSFVEQ
ncbi:MAG: hypothetical protein ABSF26_15725 [Thermoguttaceae bacterium]